VSEFLLGVLVGALALYLAGALAAWLHVIRGGL
jgi:hypothetical protein